MTLVFLVCGVVSALLAGALASAQEGKPKPIAEDLKERPESEFGLAVGVRFLF